MTKFLVALTAIASLSLMAQPAQAQVMVYDATSYASLVRQAATALDQLQQLKSQVAQAKSLYDGFNTLSHAGLLANQLNTPQLRALAPDIDSYLAAAQGDLGALGELGQKALALRRQNRLYTADPSDAAGQDLERAGDRATRDLALSQQVGAIGAARLTGLQQLAAAVDKAPNVRAVIDLQARLTAEEAMISNDLIRLQGLAMSQAAEIRLETQRDQERVKAARAARMKIYQQAFQ